MAYPVVATESGGSATGIAPAMTLPTGIVAGDLLLGFIANASGKTFTGADGWTLLSQVLGGGTLQFGVFYKVADGSEGATDAPANMGTSNLMFFRFMRITGADTTTTIEAASSQSATDPADSPNLDPAGWGTEDTLWISTCAVGAGTIATVSTYPSGYSGGASSGTSANKVGTSWKNNTVSAENPGAFATSSSQWDAWTVAVRPAAVLTPPLLVVTRAAVQAALR